MENGNRIYFATRMKGGISLGKYSIVNTCHYRLDLRDALKRDSVRHEAIGHARQSLYLGWLYLIVIGLPSIINACLCNDKNKYYRFYTERWADRLADVER